jgi:hypothetical protein
MNTLAQSNKANGSGGRVNVDCPMAPTLNDVHSGNPAFLADGYHINGNSAAYNAGVDDPAARNDIDGHARPQFGYYDLEAVFGIYVPLIVQ